MLDSLKKSYSMKFSKVFKIMKPDYIFLKLTPLTSIRNYNSSIIAKATALTYRNNVTDLFNSIRKYIRKEEEKVFHRSPSKISYYIYMEKEKVEFYVIVPEIHLGLIKEKIGDCWKGITITKVDSIPIVDKNKSISYQLYYKKEDGLSLATDKRTNDLLESQLNILDFMEDKDKISILYNLIPCSQISWKSEYKETLTKYQNRQPVDKEKFNEWYFVKKLFSVVYQVLDTVMECFNEVMGGENKKVNQSVLELALGLEKKEISKATTSKVDKIILKNQIVIQSESEDYDRRKNNALGVCQSFHTIGEDNGLDYKMIKDYKGKVIDYRINGVIENKMSVDEMQNFLALPGREILDKHKGIEKIDVLEVDVPKELQRGYIRLGQTTVKGKTYDSYMSDDKNLANLGLTVLGPQGAGKSEYFKNYAYDVINKNEGLVVIDFIKNCELSETIKSVTPKDKLIEIDLTKHECLQGFGYNEISFREDMTEFEILETANMQVQQDMSLIDAINSDGSPLTSRMRRFLSSAATISHIKENTSLRDVINILEDYEIRRQAIESVPENLKSYLQDEIRALEELNEYSKVTKDNPVAEIIGTRESKIEHIIDRINLLKEDFKMKFMFNKGLDKNIDFAKEMDEGKVILIKMPQSKYSAKHVKNVLVTYFVSKVWMATQIRGQHHEKPLRNHILIDEIFQAPTSERLLVDILPQCRKFQLKFIFSAHYLNQIETIRETLKASGSSYMLLQGTDKKNYSELGEELKPYELEDLLNLQRFCSLNLIKVNNGYARFITKLPKPI